MNDKLKQDDLPAGISRISKPPLNIERAPKTPLGTIHKIKLSRGARTDHRTLVEVPGVLPTCISCGITDNDPTVWYHFHPDKTETSAIELRVARTGEPFSLVEEDAIAWTFLGTCNNVLVGAVHHVFWRLVV